MTTVTEFRYAADLPPYDAGARCPKCGGKKIGVAYHDYYEDGFPCEKDVIDEHLCRVCARCGHGWCEATAEAKKPAKVAKRGGNVRALREGK